MNNVTVYRDELGFLGLGYPLYEPGPSGYDRVRIGDVGVITKEGAFLRCFNILRGEDDPVNTKFGTPNGFSEISQLYAEEFRCAGLEAATTLKSEHIRSIEVSGSIQIQEYVHSDSG